MSTTSQRQSFSFNCHHAIDLLCISEPIQSTGTIDVYFSPRGGATEAIVKEINSAKSEILVQAYSFTSTHIAKALVEAKKRGIKIEAVLDKSQRNEKYTSADFVAHAEILTYIDSAHAIAHQDHHHRPEHLDYRKFQFYQCG